MSWEAYWYAQDCPKVRSCPKKVSARAIALAHADGSSGYRSTGGDIWFLPETVTPKRGWYHLGAALQKEVFRWYKAAIEEACNRNNGSASNEDIVTVLKDDTWQVS